MEIHTITDEDVSLWKQQTKDLFKRDIFGFITIIAIYTLLIYGIAEYIPNDNVVSGYITISIIQLIIGILFVNIVVLAHEVDNNRTISVIRFWNILLQDYKKTFRFIFYMILFQLFCMILGAWVFSLFNDLDGAVKSVASSLQQPSVGLFVVNLAAMSMLIAAKFFIVLIFTLGFWHTFTLPLMIFFDLDYKEARQLSKDAHFKNYHVLSRMYNKFIFLGFASYVIPFLGYYVAVYFSIIIYLMFRHVFIGTKVNQTVEEKSTNKLPEVVPS